MYTYLSEDRGSIPTMGHVKNKNQLYNNHFFHHSPDHTLMQLDNATKTSHNTLMKSRCMSVSPIDVSSNTKDRSLFNTKDVYYDFLGGNPNVTSSPYGIESFTNGTDPISGRLLPKPNPKPKPKPKHSSKHPITKLNKKIDEIQKKINEKKKKIEIAKHHISALKKEKGKTKDKKKLNSINKSINSSKKNLTKLQKELVSLQKQKRALVKSTNAHEQKQAKHAPKHPKPSTVPSVDDADDTDLSGIQQEQSEYNKKRTEMIVGLSMSVFIILVVLGLIYYYYRK